MPNIVYVLTNAAMPGIVKIGMTDRPDVQQRMSDLYTTGTPLPFDCVVAWEFEGANAAEVERALHLILDPHRINPNREFFQVDPEGPKALLCTYPGRDVTPPKSGPSTDPPPDDQAAAADFKRRQSQTDETEFLESLDDNGRMVYEHVLALAKQDDLQIRWGRKGFTLYIVPSGAVVCRGYPPTAYRQYIHTDFGTLRNRANLPPDAVETLRADALKTKLFEPIGQGDMLGCQTDRRWDEHQLQVLTGWLSAVAERVREFATVNASKTANPDARE